MYVFYHIFQENMIDLTNLSLRLIKRRSGGFEGVGVHCHFFYHFSVLQTIKLFSLKTGSEGQMKYKIK